MRENARCYPEVRTQMELLPDPGTLLLPFRSSVPTSRPPLKAGIVFDGGDSTLPFWIARLISFLGQIPGLEVRMAALTPGNGHRPSPPLLTDELYQRSLRRFDPFRQLPAAPPRLLKPEQLRNEGCDVVFWLSDRRDGIAPLTGLARHGVVSLRLGLQNEPIPFWHELTRDAVTSSTFLFRHIHSLESGKLIRVAETSSALGLFVTENLEQPLTAAIRMMAGVCLELRDTPSNFEAGLVDTPEQRITEAHREYPGSVSTAIFAARRLFRSVRLRMKTRGKNGLWFVGIRPNKGQSIASPAHDLSDFREMAMPAGIVQMADPFVHDFAGRSYLLYEEVGEGREMGRLAASELLSDGSAGETRLILEQPYHLSYPCLLPVGNDLFIMPESSDNRTIDLYRFRNFPWDLEHVATPVRGPALVDTTPVFIEDRWYIFTTTTEPFLETFLFMAMRLEGPWTLHPASPVSSSVRNSRSAGKLFWQNGKLYRPTQDCSVRYGYGMSINEITAISPTRFEEKQVSHVRPDWKADLLATHTWNESPSFQVLDARQNPS